MEKEKYLSIQERVIANKEKLGVALTELFAAIAELDIGKFNARMEVCLGLLKDLESDLDRLPNDPWLINTRKNISKIRDGLTGPMH